MVQTSADLQVNHNSWSCFSALEQELEDSKAFIEIHKDNYHLVSEKYESIIMKACAEIEKIYQLLLPGGELLIGNYHVDNPDKWFMEYWHDWVLYYRTEDEFKNLLRDTDAIDIDVSFEEAKCQLFLSAKRPI